MSAGVFDECARVTFRSVIDCDEPGGVRDHPVDAGIDRFRVIALGHPFHQVSISDHLIVGGVPLFAPFRGEAGIRFDGDQVEGGVGRTELNHNLRCPDVHTHAHAADEGGIVNVDSLFNLVAQPLLSGGFRQQDILRPVAGKAASV